MDPEQWDQHRRRLGKFSGSRCRAQTCVIYVGVIFPSKINESSVSILLTISGDEFGRNADLHKAQGV